MIAAARSEGPVLGGVFDARAIVALSGFLIASSVAAADTTGTDGVGAEFTAAGAAGLPLPRDSWIMSPMTATTGPMPTHTRFPVLDSVLHLALYHGRGVGIISVGAIRPMLVRTVGTSVGP